MSKPVATVTISSQSRNVCDLLTLCARPYEVCFYEDFKKGENSGKHGMVNLDDLFQQISHPKGQTDIQLMGAHASILANDQWITKA